jgi:DNA-binding XRE family transcriptional regulator/mannose-6-phosphate isomerase-like protein (cupin superfamily)
MDEQIIGATIRQIRTAAGLTLTALAKKAEITKSTLSKIENGQVSSPIATLVRLAHALRVPLAEFFTEPHIDPPFVVTRRGKGRIIPTDGSRFGYTYEALALGMRHKTAEPFVLTIRPEDGVGEFRHGGEEFIYMLSGRLRFTVGPETLTLGPGDSLAFDPRLKHTTRAIGKAPARFLCFFVHDAINATRKKR